MLRYSSRARALANLFWWNFGDSRAKKLLESKLRGFSAVVEFFPGTQQQAEYIGELHEHLVEFANDIEIFHRPLNGQKRELDVPLIDEAAEYLFYELTDRSRKLRSDLFVTSQTAADLFRDFHEQLKRLDAEGRFAEAMKAVKRDTVAAFELARDWTTAFLLNHEGGAKVFEYRDELAELIMDGQFDERAIIAAKMELELFGMIGSHAMIKEGSYSLRFNQLLDRLGRFEREIVPRFEQYHDLKSELIDQTRQAMKLGEFQPRVLTSFVRNKLIDDVYLPLLGDNLAKQIGSTGEGKRTDRQGLLLLISPPGYGKTTLMEYIANRLGIIFMKINGPALGHDVTSLDPAAAPNAGAREEIEKLNLAFEMGDNVMIYLDDIQHCNTEFLQKFISLCDAQRKIEGVYKGRTRTYDFRGKKVAVVMAGNPYTESGEKFQIPDMLSNRADIYNLGEIIGDTAEAFEMSYIENALTSNPVLAKLSSRSQKDVYSVIKMAERTRRGDATPSEGLDFEASYSMEELSEFVNTMIKLMRVRDVVLRVNQEYITSAAQHDDYRTEPPFLLQGSYRNMNRIAEKVLPVMNDAEIESLINASYQNDAQTLTSGTEANLLKFKELIGAQTSEQRDRWEDIKRTFRQNVKMRGIGADDKVGQVIATLTTFTDGLESIRKAVSQGATTLASQPQQLSDTSGQDLLREELRALSLKMAEGLEQMAQLSNRPINVSLPPIELPKSEAPAISFPPIEIPPIEIKWPEQLPIANEFSSDEDADSNRRGISRAKVVDEETPVSPDQITIINRLPRSVYAVLESQFQLMEQWMKPLAEMTSANHDELIKIKPMLAQCLKDYRRLLKNMDAANDRD